MPCRTVLWMSDNVYDMPKELIRTHAKAMLLLLRNMVFFLFIRPTIARALAVK